MFPVYHQNNDSPPREKSSSEEYSIAFKESARRAIDGEAEAYKVRLTERSARKALLSGARAVCVDDVIDSRDEIVGGLKNCNSCIERSNSSGISLIIGGSLLGAGISAVLGLTYIDLATASNFVISAAVALIGLLIVVQHYYFRPPPR